MKLQVTKAARLLARHRVQEFGTQRQLMQRLREEQEAKRPVTKNQQDVIVGMKLQKLKEKPQDTIVDGQKRHVLIVVLEIKQLISLRALRREDQDGMRLLRMQLHH